MEHVDPYRDPRWDAFVESHPHRLIFHLSDWSRVIERAFSHIQAHHLALVDGQSGEILAGIPIYHVRSILLGRRLISVPFAPFADPLLRCPDDMAVLLNGVLQLAADLRTTRLSIKTLRAGDLATDPRLAADASFKHHFIALDSTVDQLRKKLHRTSTRPLVKRAEKSGLLVSEANQESDLLDFYRLYASTRSRLGLPPHPFRFFSELWRAFASNRRMIILFASLNGNRVGALLLYHYAGRLSAEAIGVSSQYTKLHVNHFLFWQAIRLAYEMDCTIFDFGRTSSSNHGLLAFKRHWATQEVNLITYLFPKYTIFQASSTQNSLSYIIFTKTLKFFPDVVNKKLGDFCYKHIC